MKTTLNLNDRLLQEAKAFAAQRNTSLTRLLEEGLQMRLRAGQAPQGLADSCPVALPVYAGRSGLQPGLSAVSARALLDALDETGGAPQARHP